MNRGSKSIPQIPGGLAWLKASPGGAKWLASLQDSVNSCVERWDLRLGPPFPSAYTSLTVPARRPDGADVVLKIPFPHRESEHETLALERWDGDGAIRLLDNGTSPFSLASPRYRRAEYNEIVIALPAAPAVR